MKRLQNKGKGCVRNWSFPCSPPPFWIQRNQTDKIPKVHIIQAAKSRVCRAPRGMHLDAHWVGFASWDSFPLGICLLRVCRCLWGFTSFRRKPVYSSVSVINQSQLLVMLVKWRWALSKLALFGKFLLLLYGLSCLSGFKMNRQRIGWQRVGGERREETDVSWLTLRASWQITLKEPLQFWKSRLLYW